MAVQTFNKAVGEVIALRFIDDWATSDDDGIRIKPDIESGDCTQILSWTPACEMEGWPDAPDALTHPSLPYPFTAKELAAFLLAGAGSMVAEYYGDFSDGPDEDNLQALGIKAGHARDALRQAYTEIRRAIAEVGEVDQELQQKAFHLRSQFNDANGEANRREGLWEPGISEDERRVRRERARQSVEELKVEMDSVGRDADSALKHWNRAMVKALLYPTPELTDAAAPPEAVLMPPQAQQSPPDTPAPELTPTPQPEPAHPLPLSQAVSVVAESAPDFDNCLPTPQVATLFDGLPFSADRWRKNLSGNKWLQPAKRSAGEQGGASAMWCPLALAQLVHARATGVKEKATTLKKLNSLFNRNDLLAPHRDAWREFFQLMNND